MWGTARSREVFERARPAAARLRPPSSRPARPRSRSTARPPTAAAPHQLGRPSARGILNGSSTMLQMPTAGSCGLQRRQTPQACRIADLRGAVRSARAAAVDGGSGANACRQRGQLQIAASLTKRADELNTSGGESAGLQQRARARASRPQSPASPAG